MKLEKKKNDNLTEKLKDNNGKNKTLRLKLMQNF